MTNGAEYVTIDPGRQQTIQNRKSLLVWWEKKIELSNFRSSGEKEASPSWSLHIWSLVMSKRYCALHGALDYLSVVEGATTSHTELSHLSLSLR